MYLKLYILFNFNIIIASSCKKGAMECSGNLLRICTDEGYWSETECPAESNCSNKGGSVGCNNIENSEDDISIDKPLGLKGKNKNNDKKTNKRTVTVTKKLKDKEQQIKTIIQRPKEISFEIDQGAMNGGPESGKQVVYSVILGNGTNPTATQVLPGVSPNAMQQNPAVGNNSQPSGQQASSMPSGGMQSQGSNIPQQSPGGQTAGGQTPTGQSPGGQQGSQSPTSPNPQLGGSNQQASGSAQQSSAQSSDSQPSGSGTPSPSPSPSGGSSSSPTPSPSPSPSPSPAPSPTPSPSSSPSGGSSGGSSPTPNPPSGQPSSPSGSQSSNQSNSQQSSGSKPDSNQGKTDNKPGDNNASSGGQIISADKLTAALKENGMSPNSQYLEAIVKSTNSHFKDKEMAAMYLAQLAHESGGFMHLEEIACKNGCPGQYGTGAAGKSYHGRGFIQLSWPDNYKQASQALGMGDKLYQQPELVSKDVDIAVKVSEWFWDNRVATAQGVKDKKQFGLTTKAINGALECKGNANIDKSKKRYAIYKSIAKAMGITNPASESGCYTG